MRTQEEKGQWLLPAYLLWWGLLAGTRGRVLLRNFVELGTQECALLSSWRYHALRSISLEEHGCHQVAKWAGEKVGVQVGAGSSPEQDGVI